MRCKYLVMICLLFLVPFMTAAQDYDVLVTFNTNLRASYSLESRIVETVRAGTAVQVIGNFDRWLKISINNREAWMADWVPMTRVVGGAPASGIDNCCFVDRQCSSDKEWTDGYWAFQNKQCAAPTSSQQQTSVQTESSAPASGDNCCFLDWFCSSDDDWVRGFYAYQSNQCGQGGVSDGGVRIEGSAGFIFQIEQALDLLRNKAPRWYGFVVSGLDLVRQTKPPIIGVEVRTREFNLSNMDDIPSTTTLERHTLSTASVLIHEACHVHRYQAGQEYGGLVGETACVETELTALLEFAPNGYLIPNKRRVLANIHRPECQWWHGAYETCYD